MDAQRARRSGGDPLNSRAIVRTDEEAWEAYRLYQRDVLLGCFEDAELMLRRLKSKNDEDRRLVVSLLWEKRCQPWKFYRDERRAIAR